MSVTEAAALRPLMIEALASYAHYLDTLITHTNRQHVESAIWSSMTPSELETLVDVMLLFGRRSAQVALVTREIGQSWQMVQLGMILLPRFYATAHMYLSNGGIGLW